MAKPETPMTSAEAKVPVAKGEKAGAQSSALQMWRPFENLRREVDRLFEDFSMSPFRPPFRRPSFDIEPFWARSPGSLCRRSISSSMTMRSR